jgi:hypothetical protein
MCQAASCVGQLAIIHSERPLEAMGGQCLVPLVDEFTTGELPNALLVLDNQALMEAARRIHRPRMHFPDIDAAITTIRKPLNP